MIVGISEDSTVYVESKYLHRVPDMNRVDAEVSEDCSIFSCTGEKVLGEYDLSISRVRNKVVLRGYSFLFIIEEGYINNMRFPVNSDDFLYAYVNYDGDIVVGFKNNRCAVINQKGVLKFGNKYVIGTKHTRIFFNLVSLLL